MLSVTGVQGEDVCDDDRRFEFAASCVHGVTEFELSLV
jgi:hypothetical protein